MDTPESAHALPIPRPVAAAYACFAGAVSA